MNDLPKISGYRIVEKIGEGEFRETYRAWKILKMGDGSKIGDRTEIHPCAIKVYKTTDHISAGLEELKVLRDLENQPNLEKLYNFGKTESGRLFTETELIDGDPVLQKEFENVGGVRRSSEAKFTRTFTPNEAIAIAMKLADGVEYLHRNVHVVRDLNLTNVIVNNDLSVVKICDLGAIKKIGDTVEPEERPDGKEVIFAKDYLPPELWNGGRVDESTDVYALGACLLLMLSGEKGEPIKPEVKLSNPFVRSFLDSDDIRSTGDHEVDERIWNIISKEILSEDPEERFETVERLKYYLFGLERTFSLANRYTKKNVIGRFASGRFFYGSISSVDNYGTAENDHEYKFDKLLLFDVFTPHGPLISVDIDSEKLFERVKNSKGSTGVVDNDLTKSPSTGKRNQMEKPVPYLLHVRSIREDSRVFQRLSSESPVQNGSLAFIPALRGNDIIFIEPFDFDDSVEAYDGEIERSDKDFFDETEKETEEVADGLKMTLVKLGPKFYELPPPVGKSIFYKPIRPMQKISKLLETEGSRYTGVRRWRKE